MKRNDECQTIRSILQMKWDEPTSPDYRKKEKKVELHLQSCQNCANWKEQMDSINESVGFIPQFDVPEGLTQQILATVNLEKAPLFVLPSPAVVVALLIGLAVLVVYSLDSLNGWIAWAICLLCAYVVNSVLAACYSTQRQRGA